MYLLKPTTFEEVVKIEGISHGTGLWIRGQKEPLDKGLIQPEEVFGCREQVKDFLVQGGIEEIQAFYMVETLRKGKKLKPDELKLLKSCNLNKEVINNILKIKYLFPEAEPTKLGPR